jgi:hypothetical protein
MAGFDDDVRTCSRCAVAERVRFWIGKAAILEASRGRTRRGAQVKPNATPAWVPPEALGARQGLDGVTSVAAPLLAGFGLTLSALVVTNYDDLRWPGSVVIASVSSVICLIAAVQLGAWARNYSASPDDVRTWYEDFPAQKEYYLRLLARHDSLYKRYARAARASYGAGIVLLLVALALAVAPPDGAPQFDARVAAAAVAGLGALLEAGWLLVTHLDDREMLPLRARPLRKWLLPRLEDVPPPEGKVR